VLQTVSTELSLTTEVCNHRITTCRQNDQPSSQLVSANKFHTASCARTFIFIMLMRIWYCFPRLRKCVLKFCNFQPISRGISKTVQDITTEVSTNRKSHTRFLWYQNHRPCMTLKERLPKFALSDELTVSIRL